MTYIVGIDQSTQGTKAILTDENGRIVGRADKEHCQIINEKGWVSHDLNEIYRNVVQVVQKVVEDCRVSKEEIAAIAISNQRETTAAWRTDGTPIGTAVVWQCARAKEIIQHLHEKAEFIQERTGLPLSPYFPAAKMAWIMENRILTMKDCVTDYMLGTMDSWLVYKLTGGRVYKTDVSNASRTQLFNIHTLTWDEELCKLFGVPIAALPHVCDSNGDFGATTLEGYFEKPVSVCSVMGDSHAALFAQGCHEKGMVKATYGTGSSVMMNIGSQFRKSSKGLATSLAWGMDGNVSYVLEGNINYSGAVISWLKNNMGIIASVKEVEAAVAKANPKDATVLIPAFTGLSAPYWDNDAKALLYGMSRTTGKNEIVKAAVESIAFQIKDVLSAMESDCGISIQELRVDGGPTRNQYLMQFQSDITGVKVLVPEAEEFSALGVVYMAGIKLGLYEKNKLFIGRKATAYIKHMEEKDQRKKEDLWKRALSMCRSNRLIAEMA